MNAGNFAVGKTPFLGLPLITGRVFNDERGFFIESWNAGAMRSLGIGAAFVQDNHSCSRRGVVRGLHWQGPPAAQGKLIRCTHGTILDVVADIRDGSPTYGRHECVQLSAALPGEDVFTMVFIPPGFAHGFEALSDFAEVQYKCTAIYSPAGESGIRWDDPDVRVEWPVKVPLLSKRDMQLPTLREWLIRQEAEGLHTGTTAGLTGRPDAV